MINGGFSCPHVDYVMLHHEICPGTNFLDAKKTCFLVVACKGVLWVATLAGQGPGQQKLSSEFYVKNASQLWHDSDHNVLRLNVASGAIKPRGVVAVFNFPK